MVSVEDAVVHKWCAEVDDECRRYFGRDGKC